MPGPDDLVRDATHSDLNEPTVDALALSPELEDDSIATPSGGDVVSHGGLARRILGVFVENKLAVVGVVVIVFFILFCYIGPLLYHTNQTNASTALFSPDNARPGKGHPLGTDSSGFDILGRLMYGGQVSLLVGIAAAAIATVFGTLYGAISGFFGTWVDAFLMRVVDAFLSIPVLFLAIVLATVFRPSLVVFIFVIAFVSWLIPARLIRGQALSLRVREYVQAVRVMGGTRKRIVLRHIIPNSIGTIIVNATFTVADAILLLAALGYIGLGVPSPQTDWGSMLSNGTTYALDGYWWEIYPVGLCIVLVVVAFNFIGDALRDALEVRLQQR
ncbi:MAG TPA: ABC transporter permease [Acidimicrobiales bacterium]|jgi:peptide/nickel transport system permease protein|nr:ABC transporter permease [Acidimicrobiales bacterium]